MDIQTIYHATVHISETEQVCLHTMFYGGNWTWFGHRMEVVGKDELGCQQFKMVESVECGPLVFYVTSEDAIQAAVARFDGTEEEGPEDQAPDFTEDDYPGDVMPTGWDAQDHKAMYE